MDDSIKKLTDTVEELKKEVNVLKQKRTGQADYIPQSIKNRHMGQANSYIYAGLAADLPAEGTLLDMSTSVYFALDTFTLYCWTGTAWKSEVFT